MKVLLRQPLSCLQAKNRNLGDPMRILPFLLLCLILAEPSILEAVQDDSSTAILRTKKDFAENHAASKCDIQGLDFRDVDEISTLLQLRCVRFSRCSLDKANLSEVARIPNIEQVEFLDSTLTWIDLAELRDAKTLKAIEIVACQGLGDGCFPGLAELVQLRRLRITNLKNVPVAQLELLGKLRQLEVLALVDAVHLDDTVKLLGQMPHLKRVLVYGSNIGIGFLTELAQLPDLAEIDLFGNRAVDDAGLACLGASKSLCSIAIELSKHVSDRGVIRLLEKDQLVFLAMTNGLALKGEFLKILGTLRRLNSLLLYGVMESFESGSWSLIEQPPSVQELAIGSKAVARKAIEHVRTWKNLKVLTILDGGNLSLNELNHLVEFTNIEVLEIDGISEDIPAIDITKLVESIRKSRGAKLRHISFQYAR